MNNLFTVLAVALIFAGSASAASIFTGATARSESSLDQKGSIARFGSSSISSLGGNGQMQLQSGVLLVSSGEGFPRRSPVQVITPQGDFTVRGSAIMAAMPDGSVKLSSLQGGVGGSLGGESLSFYPGQLLVQRVTGARDNVQINLATLITNSPVLGQQFQSQLSRGAITLNARDAGSPGAALTSAALSNLVLMGKVLTSSLPSLTASSTTSPPSTVAVTLNQFGTGRTTSQGSLNTNAGGWSGGRLVSNGGGTSATLTLNNSSNPVFGGNILLTVNALVSQNINMGPSPVAITLPLNLPNINTGVTVSPGGPVLVTTNPTIPNGGIINGSIYPATINLNAGTLIISPQYATAFLNARTQVIGIGGVTLTPITGSDGSLTFTNGSN